MFPLASAFITHWALVFTSESLRPVTSEMKTREFMRGQAVLLSSCSCNLLCFFLFSPPDHLTNHSFPAPETVLPAGEGWERCVLWCIGGGWWDGSLPPKATVTGLILMLHTRPPYSSLSFPVSPLATYVVKCLGTQWESSGHCLVLSLWQRCPVTRGVTRFQSWKRLQRP